MIHFPTLQPFLLNVTTNDIVDVKSQIEVMKTATHMGTHMDAPRHFNEKGITIDEIPIKNFNHIRACVIDVRNKTKDNPEYQFDIKDIEAWENVYGPLPNGSVVLFRSGWGERWSDTKKFLGTDQPDPKQLKFPGLSAKAAAMLAQRQIVGVGTECVSIDPNGEATKAAHRAILGSPNSLFILENLANLDKLPEKGARIQAYPMKIGKGSGAPARVVACFKDKTPTPTTPRGRSSLRSGRRRQH